jgi:hypothetical protein
VRGAAAERQLRAAAGGVEGEASARRRYNGKLRLKRTRAS